MGVLTLFSKLNLFQWQGSGKVYTLPWLKNRLEYSADPKRIAEYAKTPFTRSRFVMAMLTQFHLSQNSIVVSEDSHAMWLKRVARPHMPTDEVIPQIARGVIERSFPLTSPGQGEQSLHISDRLIRELYRTLLADMLQVQILKPLEDYILCTKFPHGSRPMVLEGLMYSFRLHLPFLRPIRFLLDSLFFKEVLYMKRVSAKLEQMVYDFTIPKPKSWFAALTELRASGKITRAQFRGEITSMLVSSFSLASALGSALLCLAARPQYQQKIHDEPAFARYFVMEVLRLYPPFRQFGYEQALVGNDSHSASEAKHEFMIPLFALHRDSTIWKNPNKFYPERFLAPDVAKGFNYLPFGMGKRSCPGRNFSMMLIAQALKFICSDESPIRLVKRGELPIGGSGRLVSFALDDTLSYRAR
jgi:hypothetical protein